MFAKLARLLGAIAWITITCASVLAQPKEERDLALVVGEQASLPAQGVRQYSEGVPGIVDVRLPRDGSQFVLVALKPGATTLLLIMEDGRHVQYRISVLSPDEKRQDESAVSAIDNIRLDFYFVELSESYSHQVGVGWPGTIGGEGVFSMQATLNLVEPMGVASASAVVANQVLPRLDLAQASGWARILRQAVLVTANGNEANYESGGEVNVAIQGALTAEVRSITYGSHLKVMPRYDRESGRIELRITADVSDLTSTSAAIPGRTTSHLDTVVNVEMGQGIMLAGILAESHGRTKGGIPYLSQVPVLGALFGSHGRRQERTKNVLFIVPTVVETMPGAARRHIEEALRVYKEFMGNVEGAELGRAPSSGEGSTR